MAAAKGIGQEAFGKEVSFFDQFLQIFNNVPIFSNLARYLVEKWGWEHEAELWIPRLTIILLATFIGMVPLMIRIITHASMVMSRFKTKGVGSTGRLATLMEIFRQYTISSKLSYHASVYGAAGLFVGLSLTFLRVPDRHGIWFFLLTSGLGYLFGLMRKKTYAQVREAIQPFPLGKYRNLFDLYLTGGERYSFIRGDEKDQRESHTIIIGPPGSGKTTKYFITGTLEDAHSYCSAIIVEAKASNQEDMFKLIAPTWIAQGKKVILYDPWSEFEETGQQTNTDGTDDNGKDKDKTGTSEADKKIIERRGVSFNPLLTLEPSFDDPKTRDAIESIIDAIFKTYEVERGTASGDAAIWGDTERRILKGLLTLSLFKPLGQRNLAAVGEVVGGTLESVRAYINSTINVADSQGAKLAEDVRKNLMWFTDSENGNEQQKATSLQGLAGKMSIFTHPRVRNFVVKDELDLDVIFKEPTLVCIKSPLNVPGASTIASIIIRLIMARVPDKFSYGAGKNFKMYFYLDELPSLSVPKFEQFCKTARSSGTGVIAAVQDETDFADVIRAKLGISSVRGLLSNFKTQIILPGVQHGTAEYFSRSFGMTEIKTRRNVRDTKNPVDFSYVVSSQEVPLMQPDNIRYMDKRQAIVVDSNNRPFFCEPIPWYKHPRYKKMVDDNKKRDIIVYKKACADIKYDSPVAPNYRLTGKDAHKTVSLDPLGGYAIPGNPFVPQSASHIQPGSAMILSKEEANRAEEAAIVQHHADDVGIGGGKDKF